MKKNNPTGEVEFMAGPGWLQNPDEVGEKKWSRALQIALGFGNFRYQLMLNKNVKKDVPAVDFADSVASVGELLNHEQKICHAHRVFHNKVQGNFHKHPNQALNKKRVKGVAGRAKY